jgi:hypothetical protein
MDRLELDNLSKALIKYGDYITNIMKDELVSNKKVATGNLVNDMRTYVEEEDDKAFLYLDVPSYGKFVQSGRKPNSKFPPDKPIRGWVRDKGIAKADKKANDSFIYLLRRAIGIRGIEPLPFMDIWNLHTDELEEIIEDAAEEDVLEAVKDFVKDFNTSIQ